MDDYGFLGNQPPSRTSSPFGPTAQDSVNETAASPGGVLRATLPDGTQYTPMTIVKNQDQADGYGADIGSTVPVMVPPGVDPQAMVDRWKGKTPLNPLDDGSFAQTWWPKGPNDYKNKGPMYDAYGNFEYGATGTKMGQSPETLTNIGHADSLLRHGTLNNPINTKDIQSGADAVTRGGALSIVPAPQGK